MLLESILSESSSYSLKKTPQLENAEVPTSFSI
jgi:hypothetical protein